MELALAHHVPRVADLQQQISSRDFAEWQAFISLYGPIGPERADWHAAQIQATLLNIYRGKGQRPVTVKECLLRFGPAKEPQTVHEMEMLLTDWLRRAGATKRH